MGERPGFDGGGERVFGNDDEPGREGAMRQAVVEDDRRGFGVVQHEGQLALGEVRRGEDGNEAACDRSEKRDRVGGTIAQADEDPVAGLQLVPGAEGIGSPKHSLLQRRRSSRSQRRARLDREPPATRIYLLLRSRHAGNIAPC